MSCHETTAHSHVHQSRAMGTRLVVEVTGSSDLLNLAVERVVELERRWSRFLPDSDISRCNATRGIPVTVSADTRTLVRHGIAAWRRTGGTCDPSVLDAVIGAGYRSSFDELTTPAHDDCGYAVGSPGCAGITIDDELETVTLPTDTGFDPGAIGKGLAADLVVDELLDAGAQGAFISIGGDIRCAGSAAYGDGWAVPIIEPSLSDQPLGAIHITGGAIATSTDRRRRWTSSSGDCHHIIDPATGQSADLDATLVTTVAGEAWWAEAVATQLFMTPAAEWASTAAAAGVAALIVDRAGRHHLIGAIQDYLR